MAIRIIREDGDPILRKRSREVDEITDKIQVLIDDMIETMYAADGVGLAAVQIGVLKRIIVVDIYDNTGAKVLINPEIISEEGKQMAMEGCLSVPGKSGEVIRPAIVKVTGLDRHGNRVEYKADELLARAFCHEIDHLNGILFTDKVVDGVVS